MRLTITDRAKADFAFYRDTPLDMVGVGIGCATAFAPSGVSAMECWFAKDAHGKTLPCREPELLDKVLRGKASVNLQVKLWAEDVANGKLLPQAELVEYVHGWPEWVLRAVMAQAGKIATRIVGFSPRFARAEYVMGNLWLPEMDSFDASI